LDSRYHNNNQLSNQLSANGWLWFLRNGVMVKYRGNFDLSGIPQGHGEMICEENGRQFDYRGSFLNGEFHGQGSLRVGNSYYVGGFQNSLKHGAGREEFLDGNGNKRSYEGVWVDNNLKAGCLLFTHNGMVMHYHGGLDVNGLAQGEGVLTCEICANGEHKFNYRGNFLNGKFHGRGSLQGGIFNTYSYNGTFVDGKFDGQGSLQIGNKYYAGGFKDGLKHGVGREEYLGEDGKRKFYEGIWIDGNPQVGYFKKSDSEKVEGFWQGEQFVVNSSTASPAKVSNVEVQRVLGNTKTRANNLPNF
jgi:hypothetical protein